ncbi:UDP-glucuronosyl/UDP-glucosyltransferase [Heracleum sosnowskyi]|uniref:UDP-glucuronosyl/UDP-glucosyltransferase n=1 Tax=Heracleum sosnowskyi TaxID=360622 RepID=A0AAD8LY11_9APIA|nr:UDP-glucuronosyl/UDP-glucosyltransferase [Heracleum sosnowskyi]
MSIPHILLVPYPAQGHVMPLMELAQIIAKRGLKVTFVNTDFLHNQIVNALSNKDGFEDGIHMVSLPNGLEPWEDRMDIAKVTEAVHRFMPGKLQELIENINNAEDDDKISCVIADVSVGWALEVADNLNIRPVVFCPAAAAQLAVFLSLPKLLENGIVENDGNITKKQIIHLSPTNHNATREH